MSTNSENSRKHLDEINNRKWPRFEKKKKEYIEFDDSSWFQERDEEKNRKDPC